MTDTSHTPGASLSRRRADAPGRPPLPPEELAGHISRALEADVLGTSIAYGQLTVDVAPHGFVRAARLCKTSEALACDFFDFLCGVDAGEDGFFVVLHVYSTSRHHHVQLRMLAPGGREEPIAPSVTSVYRGANWSEREAHDMYGITFTDHPDLLPRLLTVENFEGWPLRKDFLLMTREVKPWPGAKEPEERKDHAGGDGGPERPAATGAAPGVDKAEAAKAKAERAKAKAAEMRAKKAAERAAGQQASAGSAVEDQAAAAAATADQEPAGDGSGAAASTPEGAAAVDDSAIAKDAAAGAVQGDVGAGAPGDAPTDDQPVDNSEHEAVAAEGGAPTASGTPGVEAEGRHAGADEQSGERPAADTPGMTAQPPGHAAQAAQEVAPAPGPQAEAAATRERAGSPAEQTDEPGGADVPVTPAPGSEDAPVATDETAEEAEQAEQGRAAEVRQDDDPIVSGGTDAADRSAAPDTRSDPEASDSPDDGRTSSDRPDPGTAGGEQR